MKKTVLFLEPPPLFFILILLSAVSAAPLLASEPLHDDPDITIMWCNTSGDIVRKASKMKTSKAMRLFNLPKRKKGEVLLRCSRKDNPQQFDYLWHSDPEHYLKRNCCGDQTKKIIANTKPSTSQNNFPACKAHIITRQAEPLDLLRLSDTLEKKSRIVIRLKGEANDIPLFRKKTSDEERLIAPLIPSISREKDVTVLSLGTNSCSLGSFKYTPLKPAPNAFKELIKLELELLTHLIEAQGISINDLYPISNNIPDSVLPYALLYDVLNEPNNPQTLYKMYEDLKKNSPNDAKLLDAVTAKSGLKKTIREVVTKLRSLPKSKYTAAMIPTKKHHRLSSWLNPTSHIQMASQALLLMSTSTAFAAPPKTHAVLSKDKLCVSIKTPQQLENHLQYQKAVSAWADGGRRGKQALDNAGIATGVVGLVAAGPALLLDIGLLTVQTTLDVANSLLPKRISNLRFDVKNDAFYEDHDRPDIYHNIKVDASSDTYKFSQAAATALGVFLVSTGAAGHQLGKNLAKAGEKATGKAGAKLVDALSAKALKASHANSKKTAEEMILSTSRAKRYLKKYSDSHAGDGLGLGSNACARYANCGADNIKSQPVLFGPCEYKNIPLSYEYIKTHVKNGVVTANNKGSFQVAKAGQGALVVSTRASRLAGRFAQKSKPITVHAIQVTASPSFVEIKEDESQTFSASVEYAYDKGITWEISSENGYSSTASGKTFEFTAPQIAEDKCEVKFTAKAISTSRQGIRASGIPERFNVAHFTVKQSDDQHPACHKIVITPRYGCLENGKSYQFEAEGIGEKIDKKPSVIWSASIGKIHKGRYTVPEKTQQEHVIIKAKTTQKPYVSNEVSIDIGCSCFYSFTSSFGSTSGTKIGISENISDTIAKHLSSDEKKKIAQQEKIGFGGVFDFITGEMLDSDALLKAFKNSGSTETSSEETEKQVASGFADLMSSMMNPKIIIPPISAWIYPETKTVRLFTYEVNGETYYAQDGANLTLDVSNKKLLIGRITGTLADANKKRHSAFEFKFRAAKGGGALCSGL
ncbi:MAG TPA: hypothetical protein ENJ33_04400 [Thiothrix sp.]|nr:hypothetical protein [Thiothrix sp.]